MHCMHYVLHALCIACIMHCMHYALHALCILCIMHCMHQAQSYSSCRYYTGILLSVIYFWISLRTDLLTNIATYRAAIAAKKRCVLLYLIISDSTLHDCITITLFYYCTFYYCTTPTENSCNEVTGWHYYLLLHIELLTDITTFRASIAAKILSYITTFNYNTSLLM